jgi:hypothetical protein
VIFVLFAGKLGSLKSSLKEADGEFVKVLAGFSLSLSLPVFFSSSYLYLEVKTLSEFMLAIFCVVKSFNLLDLLKWLVHDLDVKSEFRCFGHLKCE